MTQIIKIMQSKKEYVMSLPLGSNFQIFSKLAFSTQLTSLPCRFFPVQAAHYDKVNAHIKYTCKSTHTTHLEKTSIGLQQTKGQESPGSHPKVP